MKKKVSFAIVVLVSCLVILLSVVVKLPNSVHAAGKTQVHPATTPTITVSPNVIDYPNAMPPQCTNLGLYTFVSCPVQLSINNPTQKRIRWSSSFTETLCQEGICAPDYNVAVLPSKGFFSPGNYPVQVNILVNVYCYHGSATATIVFAILGSQAKVSYSCIAGG